MINPYTIIAAIVLWVASLAGAGWWGIGVGRDGEIAKQASAEKIRQETRDAAQQGAADAIVKAAAENTKTVTKIKTVTREVPVYRDAACSHDLGVWNDLNGALRGEPAGPGLVPPRPGRAP